MLNSWKSHVVHVPYVRRIGNATVIVFFQSVIKTESSPEFPSQFRLSFKSSSWATRRSVFFSMKYYINAIAFTHIHSHIYTHLLVCVD